MRSRLLAVLAALVVTACTGSPSDDATGAQIFGQMCAGCHGRDLAGSIGPSLGPGSAAAGYPDEAIAEIIRRGRGSRMPAFSGALSDTQVDLLIGFLREQQAG